LAFSTLLILLVPSIAFVGAAAAPHQNDFFEYDYNIIVDNGIGWYYGYSETMHSHSRYDIVSVDGDLVTIHRTGSWSFTATDGSNNWHLIDSQFSFDISTRKYVGGNDLDFPTIDPTVWFWVPTPMTMGDHVQVLDDTLTVTNLDSTTWLGLLPHKGVAMENSGSYFRNDVYGQFDATFTDVYHFDKESGIILSERYTEQDVMGQDSFRYREEITLTASGYSIPLDFVQILVYYVGIPAALVVIVFMVVRWRYGASNQRLKADPSKPDSGPVSIKLMRVRKMDKMVGLGPGGSYNFTPLIPVFVHRAIEMRDPAVVAVSEGKILGMATRNRESRMGSVFAEDPRVAKALLRRLRMQNFFLDTKGQNWVFPGATLLDAFDVLKLDRPSGHSFDSNRIRPMTAADVPQVVRIAEQVYRGRAKKWIGNSFKNGDVAFVAVRDNQVVGFAFATVAGRSARLHTLTVLPQYRAQGLGAELMAARLNTLSALGVDEALLEISKYNMPSMLIAKGAGFVKVGESAYYSRNPEMADVAAQRRL
jgi:ribosomal protein S18 acetylase RimI-like enzyme